MHALYVQDILHKNERGLPLSKYDLSKFGTKFSSIISENKSTNHQISIKKLNHEMQIKLEIDNIEILIII